MARYTGSVCRLCRREGKKLFLKGERCYSDKCAVTRRASVPGQHGKARKKVSEYGTQLRAKQTAKRYYGVLESQFAEYFNMAERKAGVAGENLLRILESRLDNIVYRAGYASSRKEARQLVGHGHFTVNGKRVDIASYLCKAGDVIEMCIRDRIHTSGNLLGYLDILSGGSFAQCTLFALSISPHITSSLSLIHILSKDKRWRVSQIIEKAK